MRSARIRQTPNCNSYCVGEPSFLAICSRNGQVMLGTRACALNSEEMLSKIQETFLHWNKKPSRPVATPWSFRTTGTLVNRIVLVLY